MEIYFIRKYKVCNEAYGYNENYSSYSISKRYVNVTYNKRLSEIHKGMKYDRNTKMKKAKFICGVKPDKSEFYICAEMKLFGDFVGKSKDIIKNATKTQSTICDYYIIKLEYEDMIKQFEQDLQHVKIILNFRRAVLKDNLELPCLEKSWHF